MLKKLILVFSLFASVATLQAQENNTTKKQTDSADELDKLLEGDEKPQKEYARYAFKSSRVVQGHSMEMLGEGVLDFRILHRFGMFKDGFNQFFGLDQASMRMGFDYGVTKNLTIGIGRSTFNKEVDGFVKYRIAHQHTKVKPFPVSIIYVGGMTLQSGFMEKTPSYFFSNRLGYYHQFIFGRKFSDAFTLQLTPTFVHRNLVALASDKNDTYALGVGSRIRLTKRTSFIVDTYPLLYGFNSSMKVPFSLGLDIETGGHVFQLHVTNTKGMNEKSFITETTQRWDKGEIQFGFNLSRVFTVKKNVSTNW